MRAVLLMIWGGSAFAAAGGAGDTATYLLTGAAVIAALATIFRALRSLDKATAALTELKPATEALTADIHHGLGLEARVATNSKAIEEISLTFQQLKASLSIDKPGNPNFVEYLREWRHAETNLVTVVQGATALLTEAMKGWHQVLSEMQVLSLRIEEMAVRLPNPPS